MTVVIVRDTLRKKSEKRNGPVEAKAFGMCPVALGSRFDRQLGVLMLALGALSEVGCGGSSGSDSSNADDAASVGTSSTSNSAASNGGPTTAGTGSGGANGAGGSASTAGGSMSAGDGGAGGTASGGSAGGPTAGDSASAGGTASGAAGGAGGTASGGAGGGNTGGGSTGSAGGASSGGSANSVSCTPSEALCRVAPPTCPEMQVPSVEGSCWGECVPIGDCACGGPEDCPDENQYTCHNFSGRCGPYL